MMSPLSWAMMMTTVLLLDHKNIDQCSAFHIHPLKGSSSRHLNTITTGSTTTTLLHSTKSPKKKKSAASSPRAPRSPSKVSDPTGPTPELDEEEEDVVLLKDLPELQYDPKRHPIPHQPWRRGETAGCDDPIDAPWRQEAETLIGKAVSMVGATLVDVTWYLTTVLITVDEDMDDMPIDFLKDKGPMIRFYQQSDPVYSDPDDDKQPEEIWHDDYVNEVAYQRDDEAEAERKKKMYARAVDGEEKMRMDPDDDVSLYKSQESMLDDRLRITEELEEQWMNMPSRGTTTGADEVDPQKLSTIAGSILDLLELHDERLNILERHEVVLAGPSTKYFPDVLETQRQFDGARGFDVLVETQDPWESNRVLKGKLVDRNSMDVYINQQGRLVTIPLNFVRCVRLRNYKAPPEEGGEEGGVPEEDEEGDLEDDGAGGTTRAKQGDSDEEEDEDYFDYEAEELEEEDLSP
jgi:hypothetical protein